MNFLSQLSTNKRAWQLLMISALIFELIALYFQYGMGLAPCIMCIYQRNAIWGIFFAGLVGSLGCQYFIARLLAYGLWITSSVWGLLIALEHVEMQTASNPFLFSCEIVPNFPSWAPLHEWIPMLFEASGDCGKIDWQFLGFSMPEVMILIFAGFGIALALVLTASLQKKRMI